MRWTILAMLAHAFLSVMTADQPGPDVGDVHRDETGHELIPLTRNEIPDSSPACSTALAPPANSCTGHAGGGATRPPPATATTSAARPSPSPDYEVALEY
jgi:hypothetical protein